MGSHPETLAGAVCSAWRGPGQSPLLRQSLANAPCTSSHCFACEIVICLFSSPPCYLRVATPRKTVDILQHRVRTCGSMPFSKRNALSLAIPGLSPTNLGMDFHSSPNQVVMCGQLLGQEPVAWPSMSIYGQSKFCACRSLGLGRAVSSSLTSFFRVTVPLAHQWQALGWG